MREQAAERFKNMTSSASMATRLPVAVILVSLISLVVASVVGVKTGRDLGRDLTDDRLVALRASGAQNIAGHMRSLSRTADALASSPQAVLAIEAFTAAHDELADRPLDELGDEAEALVAEYRDRYLEILSSGGREVDLRDIVSESPAAVHLQYHYAIDLGVVRDPANITNARDGSRWSEIHEEVHPVYRDVVDRVHLLDLYLIEPRGATIVYSVGKRPDLGTSLDTGPFSGSFLATLVDGVRADPAASVMSDISFYDPTLLIPVGAVATPVMDEDGLAGVIVLLYDASIFTEILTAGADWDQAGFPPTGESFLLGSDGLARSDPRTFLEDSSSHLDSSVTTGQLTEAQRSFIESAGTTVLTQPAADQTVDAGLEGDRGVETRPTMVGGDSLSTVESVTLEGVSWFVATEMDVDVAEGDLDEFVDFLIVGAAIFIVGLAFVAVAWASRIVRPVRAISERLSSSSSDVGPVDVPARSPIEFRRLAESFESMSEALTSQRIQLAEAREERLRLLRRMLPPAVADRAARGEIESFDEVPQATVVVVVVLGLGALVRDSDDRASRELVDSLHGELDKLAAGQGLERVRVVGDAYFACCGHARPFIDHARRAATFAFDTRDAVRELGSATPAGLDVSVGLHTGPVTVGVTTTSRLLYDVWGEAVTAAHHLARIGASGEILASDSTRALLPDTFAADHRSGEGGEAVWTISAGSLAGPV
jgi:class 3 adenylate cyclase